jgi:hypothetical protein
LQDLKFWFHYLSCYLKQKKNIEHFISAEYWLWKIFSIIFG